MDNEIKTWLFDIKKSINEIVLFFEDEQRIFEDFQKDLRTKRAIERNLEIIGEAISRILKRIIVSKLQMLVKLWILGIELSMVTILYQMKLSGEL